MGNVITGKTAFYLKLCTAQGKSATSRFDGNLCLLLINSLRIRNPFWWRTAGATCIY
ncbi:hypothetical protein ACHJH3_01875 [Campylobacter sp. MOP7]|uniref:hypothetical protein n=1 Tax=Campylobacter canis TaxID=3378588 RepID=UPI00387E26ED